MSENTGINKGWSPMRIKFNYLVEYPVAEVEFINGLIEITGHFYSKHLMI